jgi:hypothetical protein
MTEQQDKRTPWYRALLLATGSALAVWLIIAIVVVAPLLFFFFLGVMIYTSVSPDYFAYILLGMLPYLACYPAYLIFVNIHEITGFFIPSHKKPENSLKDKLNDPSLIPIDDVSPEVEVLSYFYSGIAMLVIGLFRVSVVMTGMSLFVFALVFIRRMFL